MACELCGNNFDNGAFFVKGNAVCSSCVVEAGLIPVIQPKTPALPTWDELTEDQKVCGRCGIDMRDKEEHLCITPKGQFCDNCVDFLHIKEGEV